KLSIGIDIFFIKAYILRALKDYIMYAVIETGGKQHKVEKGMVLSIDLTKDEVGKKITFDNVLLYVDDKNVEVGQPYLSNVKVTAEVKDIVKSEKISILRFRRRKHSMRKVGHRAKHTQIEIKNIKLEAK
ncbi:MAG: 50S ribosomal protein L21, partial [Gammaproteobacteria bacterium]